MKVGIKKGLVSGIMHGITQIAMFFIFGLVIYFGLIFLENNADVTIQNVFTAIYAVMFSGMTAGNNAHFMPDLAVAKIAAVNIFEILDCKDEDQLQEEYGSKMLKTHINGNIVFKNVSFKYESRDEKVFENMNFEIKQGQKIGFVGPSGCGKSTIHQLLQRFYDSDEGEILIDGVNIRDYDIHHLRTSFGVVSQEPVLFNDTIWENIKYNRHKTTHEEIESAANESNFNPETEAFVEVIEPPKKNNKKEKEAD